ncbi:hypothetical protein QYF36_024599 [Acer negundo]|nr:hypothetical protein QYF36_024599 [Acer negundo]
MRFDQQIEGNSKIQSRVLVKRSGVNAVGSEKVKNDTLISQVEDQTDSVGELKEDDIGTHTNILSSSSGLGSSQVYGLGLKGPSEEPVLNKKKFVAEGKVSFGPGLEVLVAYLMSRKGKKNSK